MTIQKIKLGRFRQDQYGTFRGAISGLGIGTTEVFTQEAVSQDGKPYLKLIADPMGTAYEVGAAFRREKEGKVFYSVNIDSPILPISLNANLYASRSNDGTFDLVWNRAEVSKPAMGQTAKDSSELTRRPLRSGANPA